MSGDGTAGLNNEEVIIADMSSVAQSEVGLSEEHRAFAEQKYTTSSTEPAELDVTEIKEEKEVVTVPQSEANSEKPVHLFSCSESTRKNKGHITTAEIDDAEAGNFENDLRSSINRNRIFRSPLFCWIMGLIVVPVLLTMASICTTVTVNVTIVLPSWLEKAQKASEDLEVEYVTVAAVSHAALTEKIFVPPIGDLHLLTRIAGWLMFGGVNQSASFTDMNQGTEKCKTFPDDDSCGFFLDPERASCDCRWEDPFATACQNYTNWRMHQKPYYACQAHDADPGTGARNTTSFPLVDYSPNTTLWWNDTTKMPGYSNFTLVQGYATVFDRTRVMSAMAAVIVPLYNYLIGSTREKHLGIYIGFAADGMLAGYTGCNHNYSNYAHFRSNKDNGAFKISRKLCPRGKYGFDSRCRGWYDEGKRANGLHLTAPYVFASTKKVANSVTFPLVDPSSGIHVGQTLIDFLPSGIRYVATADDRHASSGFVIIVTPEGDALGGDTLAGPGYIYGSKTSPPIMDLVMPCDDPSSRNRRIFDSTVLAGMKEGDSNKTIFRRRIRDVETFACEEKEEVLFIAYRPVVIRETYPLRPDEFARGVNASDITMASLGYVVPIEELRAPFAAIEDKVEDDISRSISILIGLIAATAAIVTVVLAMVSEFEFSASAAAGKFVVFCNSHFSTPYT